VQSQTKKDSEFDFVHRVPKFHGKSVPEFRKKFTRQILQLTLLILQL